MIAETLGIMVSQVLDEMSVEEFHGWIGYKHLLAQNEKRAQNKQALRARAKKDLG